MDITLKQIENMKHCIGFRPDRVKGRKYRKYVVFRNYYTTSDINLSWENLVEFGYATKRKHDNGVGGNPQVYFVTRKGMDALEKILETQILEDKD